MYLKNAMVCLIAGQLSSLSTTAETCYWDNITVGGSFTKGIAISKSERSMVFGFIDMNRSGTN